MMKKDNRTEVVVIRLSKKELELIKRRSENFSSTSAYVRKCLFSKNRATFAFNPVELLKSIDSVSSQLKRSGNNINQLARYANTIALNNYEYTDSIMIENNKLLREHINNERELISLYKKIINI